MKTRLVTFRWIAFGVLILGLIVAAYSLVSMRLQILEIGDGAATAPTWYVTSLERDLQELQNTLAEFQLNEASAADVNLRFDILWSRANGATQGEIAEELSTDGIKTEVFNDIMTVLRANETDVLTIAQLPSDDVNAVRDALDALTDPVRALSLRALQAKSNETNAWREALLSISSYNAMISVMITSILFLLLLLLFYDGIWARRSLREKEALLVAAEAANIAKSQFISVINHELRTPLTSIKGAISLMGAGVLGEIPAKFERPIRIAERNCVQLNALITDLLDVEKLASGQMEYHFEPINLVGFLKEQVETNTPYAEVFGTHLKTTSDLPDLTAIGDPQRLSQVMANLISNAAKFSGTGKDIVVGLAQEKEKAVITVQDFGRGIPASARDRIFDRFQQVDSSDERERGGTGLGLAIIKSVVEAHGGTLDFESVVGEGTTFRFGLPLAA